MEQYGSYRMSEIPCLGSVPAHWKSSKFKFHHFEEDDTVGEYSDDYPLLSLTKEGVVFRDVESGKGKFPASFENYKVVHPDRLIFCLFDIDETPRTIGLSNHFGMITGAYKLFRTTHDLNPRFSLYTFLVIDNVKGLKPYYTGLRKVVRPETFKSLEFTLPPLHEQEKIVEYLDRKTTLIDSLIEKTVRKIELLKEKNLKIIEQITTSASTERVRLSSIVHVSERPVNRNQGGKFTKIGLFNWGRGIFCYPEESGDDLGDSSFSFLKSGDLVISGQFAWEGAISIVDEEFEGCICSHRFHVLNGIRNVVSNGYLWAFFTSQEGTFLLRENSSGSAGRNRPLNLGKLLKEKVPLPPIRDQILVEQLVHDYSQFKKHAEQKVNLLKEYRQCLISEVVTGKVKVTRDE
jgi:type I restriction enzyme S subunit